MPRFDAETLRRLRPAREVSIRTEKHPDSAVVIWVVVPDDEVFVRSWRGTRGRWYRDLAAGGSGGPRVRRPPAVRPGDPDERCRCNRSRQREFLRQYQWSSHAPEMVRTEILPTTLRLEPREATQ